jgi:hypothetical protein
MAKDRSTHVIPFTGSSDNVKRPDMFANRRHEAHWTMREMFQANNIILIPNSDQREEISAIQLTGHKKGFIAVEKKDDLKKRLGRSPNHSDCVMMMAGCYDEIPALEITRDRYKKGSILEPEYEFTPETC